MSRLPRSYRHALVTGLALALPGCSGADPSQNPSLVHTVARTDLVVTVRERAELQAATDTRVTSQLEGRATLIDLIAEGAVVKTGDKLAELDASGIAEKRASQAIAVARAEALLEQARKNFEIVDRELEAAAKTAESRLAIARMRREKFLGQPIRGADNPIRVADKEVAGTNAEMIAKLQELLDGIRPAPAAAAGALPATGPAADQPAATEAAANRHADLTNKVRDLLGGGANLGLEMGEMANQILQQIDEVNLARADLELAAETLHHSQRLAAKNYITRNELERDDINHKRQLSRVTVAWNNLQLLIKYTLRETLITLDQEIENAQLGLASVRAAGDARRVREAAELKSSEAEDQLARELLETCDRQLANAVLRAPAAGLVVYARYDWEPVYEGMEVREGQDIVLLPDITTMVAELKVHEAQIDKVEVDQRATVKVDAFPDRSFRARVTQVSKLPDPNQRSQELKVYRVRVQLEEDNRDGLLRPGMNSTVEIHVGTFAGVLAVPVPAIKRLDDAHFVWRQGPDGPVSTRVELGRSNLTHVEILDGLGPGDRVLLVPPAGAALPRAAAAPAAAAGSGDGSAR